ncbi:DUF4153 domain-containing protein [Streptacidiphilus sp. N1-12]|uniref:DUF4153 domain-containing protein n=2 Tax=Streptacidiphilus alkalitolerans TaxID=3342712 RepID=A0ABV6WQF3_9ACTN
MSDIPSPPVPPGRTVHGPDSWAVPPAPPVRQDPAPDWVQRTRSPKPAPPSPGVLVSVLLTGVVAASVSAWSFGLNVLIVALLTSLGAWLAARRAGRRPGPWSLLLACGGLLLLAVPALRDAGWPSALAVCAAVLVGALAVNGGRGWHAVLFAWVGLLNALGSAFEWYGLGLRALPRDDRRRWVPLLRAIGVASGLLVVFGALFAGADAEFAHLLGGVLPSVSASGAPVGVLYLIGGLVLALAAARAGAAPTRWDRIKPAPGRERGRLEWLLPLVVLNALFAAFIAVQLAVLFGGYSAVLRSTGLTYAEYARQGFWQLLTVTVLTLVVLALALRWAPRSAPRDPLLVRVTLGVLCLLALVVVASALRRMDLYVGAYGLTRLRVSVAGTELWLGVVLVLLMAAGLVRRGGRWLPRAVVASAVLGVLVFAGINPDGLIAAQNADRFQRTGKIDLDYLRSLSADAVPALDKLPEPQRSCALGVIADDLESDDSLPWYADNLGRSRARALLVRTHWTAAGSDSACSAAGYFPGEDGDIG